jgi:hypothetical protein
MTKRKTRPNTPKLTDKIRAGVITRFACCYSVEDVRAWLKAEHGVELEPSALSYYNGNNPGAYASLSVRWRTLFDEKRAAYFEDVAQVPISHKRHRLQIANDQIERLAANVASGRGGINLVMLDSLKALLEYAAKESGDAFTNTRILQHDARGNLAKLLGCDPDELPDGDADA